MKNFNKRGDFSDNRSSRPGMHQVICSDCGKECEVPFRPTGDRPVFCNSCFAKHSPASSSRSGNKDHQGSGFDHKRMFEAVCSKCGNKCEVPFRPTGDKPVYCSNCFGKSGSSSGKAPEQTRQQFEILNAKLDKILQALSPAASFSASKEAKKVLLKKESKKSKPAAKKLKTKKRK